LTEAKISMCCDLDTTAWLTDLCYLHLEQCDFFTIEFATVEIVIGIKTSYPAGHGFAFLFNARIGFPKPSLQARFLQRDGPGASDLSELWRRAERKPRAKGFGLKLKIKPSSKRHSAHMFQFSLRHRARFFRIDSLPAVFLPITELREASAVSKVGGLPSFAQLISEGIRGPNRLRSRSAIEAIS